MIMQHSSVGQLCQYTAAPDNHELLIVTGYSGAGKSSALKSLEDCGYFCVDNLPLELFDSFFQLIAQSKMRGQRVAIGIDVRSGHGISQLVSEISALSAKWSYGVKLLFLTASVNVLLKRFSETRRKHPLANNIDMTVAIEQEQQLLEPLLGMSQIVLNTDQLSIHQLREFVRNTFTSQTGHKLLVSLVSFGFKYGVPPESTFVYDVRCLPNPYFVPELKKLTGMDPEIVEYLFRHESVVYYWQKFLDFVEYSMLQSFQEGRYVINIAVGCTGGRHRSVACVNQLARQQFPYVQFIVTHRDMHRDIYE